MITELDMYLITRLNDIKAFFIVTSVCGLVGVLIYVIAATHELYQEDGAPVFKRAAKYGALALFVLLLGLATPSTADYAAIKLGPRLANNENLKENAGELYTLFKEYIKKKE